MALLRYSTALHGLNRSDQSGIFRVLGQGETMEWRGTEDGGRGSAKRTCDGGQDQGKGAFRQTLGCLHAQAVQGGLARSRPERRKHPCHASHPAWQRRSNCRGLRRHPSSPTGAWNLALSTASAKSICSEPEQLPHQIAVSSKHRSSSARCLRQIANVREDLERRPTHYHGARASRCSCRIRRTSLIVSAFP